MGNYQNNNYHHNNNRKKYHKKKRYNNNRPNSLNLHFNGLNLNVDIDRFGGYVSSKVREYNGGELNTDLLIGTASRDSLLLPDFDDDDYDDED